MSNRFVIIIILFTTFLFRVKVEAHRLDDVNNWIEIGKSAEKNGKIEKAIHYYKRVVEAYHECDIKNNQLGDALSALAFIYSNLGDYTKAVEYIIRAAEIDRIAHGDNHPYYASSLLYCSNFYLELGNYSKAEEYCAKALEIYKVVSGVESSDYAASLSALAYINSKLGNYSKAEEYCVKALEIYKAVSGVDSSDYAASLSVLAFIHSKLGDWYNAIEYEKQTMEVRKAILGEDNPVYVTSLSNLAHYCWNLGDCQKAIEYEKRALERRKEIIGENHPDYATSLGNLANFYHAIGDFSNCAEYYKKTLEIAKKTLGENHPEYATLLSNLSSFYSDLGDYSLAMEYSAKAIKIRKKVFGENHPDYAYSLLDCAWVYSDSGDYLKAIECCTKALGIIQTFFGENHPDYTDSLNALSYFYSCLGKHAQALEYIKRAIEIDSIIFGEHNLNYAISLVNLATCYSNLGNYSKAIECSKKTIDIFKIILGENSPDYAKLLKRIASYYSAYGEYSNALGHYKECVSIERNSICSVFSFSTAFQRTLYWNKYLTDFTDTYPALIYKSSNCDASELYNQSALFAKGLLLSTTTEINKLILESGDDEALHMFEELRLKRMELQKMYETPIAEQYVNIDSLKVATDQQEKNLVERSKVYGDYKKKLQTTWKDVQISLTDVELAVEFLAFNISGTDSTMVAALTLRKDDMEPKFFPLFEYKQLKELSDTVHFICSDLTKLVWQPLCDELKGIKTIYFSPAGVLHKIGIEYSPGMECYEMFRLSSTREVIDLKAPLKTIEDLSARLYGGINYELSSSADSMENESVSDSSMKNSIYRHQAMIDSLDLRGIQIDYLPGTLREVQNIEKTFSDKHYNVTPYLGTNATETSVKSLSGKDTGILHISTHGFYYTESQAKKKEKLRFLSFDDKHHTNYEDKALTRSGLFMAGARLTIDGKDIPLDADDGILTAKEISQLDLRGIDFVALSACETGRGDIVQGEGVFGLQRGFKKAGVKTILMSLWRVSDVSTEILMTEFYKNLCDGKSKRESLRLAQKTIREYKDDKGNLLFQDPHYWAGFVMLD